MLRISRGTWRTVIVISALGIAFKIPNIRIGLIWEHYKTVRSLSDFVEKIQDEWRYWDHPAQTPMCLFGGWLMNLQEFFFSLSYGSSALVMPTYFSLFGLINIMPAGEVCLLSQFELWKAALTVAPFRKLDPHTWSNPHNFVRDRKGRIRLVDYGERKTRRALRRYRHAFEQAFTAL